MNGLRAFLVARVVVQAGLLTLLLATGTTGIALVSVCSFGVVSLVSAAANWSEG